MRWEFDTLVGISLTVDRRVGGEVQGLGYFVRADGH